MSTTRDLTTLNINYLTQAQYDAALENNQINQDEIYCTIASDSLQLADWVYDIETVPGHMSLRYIGEI